MKQVDLECALLKLPSPLLIAGSDYTSPGAVTLTFNSTTTSQTVPVIIVDDEILEGNETFFGNLATTDDRIDINPVNANATIFEDNDGKLLS